MQRHVQAQAVFINELHYDNSGADANEGLEIAGPAGTDLSAYKLVFYNGANGSSYGELPLGGIIPAQGGTAFGAVFFQRSGIQNGSPDGIALIDEIANSVVQFLSYEGSFEAVGGSADGEISTDIGVAESGTSSSNNSLQLAGSGAVYSDFSWRSPAAASPGMLNSGQTFLGAGNPSITLALMPSRLAEGTSGMATISLFPPPTAPIEISIHNSDPGELSSPSRIMVGSTGSSTFTITAVDDGLNDGAKPVTLTASAPLFEPGSTTALVLDIERPDRGTSIRLATINTLNGVGARGSPEHVALSTLLERLEADVIAFQEVSSAGDFFDLRALLEDLAFPYLATTDDEFIGQAYEGGRFNTDQNIAIASRYPITATTQIGRAQPSRMEIARFPVMVSVDVPGTGRDPTIVAVHYKAGRDDASRFRKAVEAYRTLEALGGAGLDGAVDNLFVLGDFNEDHDRFMPRSYNTGITSFADDSTLPASYRLGDDLSGENVIELPYAQFPDRVFGNSKLITPDHRQQDAVAARTFIPLGDAALDYILHSQHVADSGKVHTEIYNSGLDAAFDGLPKQGDPALPATSFIASDHFAIVGDYELERKSKLDLQLSPRSLQENAGPNAATGTITLAEPAAQAVSVEILKARPDAPVELPAAPITFAPGEVQKTFPIDILDRPRADPDRNVTITASADDYSGASDTLLVYNLEPSGSILISQYIEPPSGTSPRGIELFNCSGRRIDLRGEPIRVVQYTNGSTSGNIEALAESGHLPAGGVLVIGDASIGNFLVSEGILPKPDLPIAGAKNGTHYLNRNGELVYVKEFFPYNGNDALEIDFAYGLSDVFGTIGQDPGAAWQSEGVSTSGRNLSLADDLAIPSAGFTQPHRRFDDTAPGSDLSGLGSAPAADDPFKHWLQSFGLSDPNADPDGDGLVNFIEFATGSDPTQAASQHTPTIDPGSFSYRQLSAPGRLRYSIEISGDLQSWTPAELELIDQNTNGDGTDSLSFALPDGNRFALRLRVIIE